MIELIHGDALEVLPTLASGSVDAVITDPPYFRVKGDEWDNQWKSEAAFLEWMGVLVREWRRVLKPNGSLFCFASPQMGARVECKIAEELAIVNSITWSKPPFATKAEMFDKETCRSYFPASERIIFAEQYGSDRQAVESAGYETQCQAALQQVFQIQELCERYGVTRSQIGNAIVADYKNIESAKAQASNWILGKNIPNPTDFRRLKELIPIQGEYEELRREYEELRREYEELRRPFNVSPHVPYTDVWTYRTVGAYPSKHPCEKPISMMIHMVEATTREDATVLDCFMGSGSTGVACVRTGRRFIGIEKDAAWHRTAQKRIAAAQMQPALELTA